VAFTVTAVREQVVAANGSQEHRNDAINTENMELLES